MENKLAIEVAKNLLKIKMVIFITNLSNVILY